jgi:protoporphyrinogen/coproporphyrinogen III oxidase
VGGGLSGLFCAYNLVKRGHEVVVYEKSSRLGGHIHTLHMPWGIVETAANAVMNSPRMQELSRTIAVPLLPMERTYRRRYIFRGRARRLPMSGLESLRFAVGALRRGHPLLNESAEQYALRHFGAGATKYLIEPAILGIFGSPLKILSARLVLDYFFKYRSGRMSRSERGSVAPEKGMGDLVKGLELWLRENGVTFKLSTVFRAGQNEAYVAHVIATDAHAAADIFEPIHSHLSSRLRHIKYQPLSSVTVATDAPGAIKGFGCLFPQDQGFSALGVLFNPYIFKGRGPSFTETWIVPSINPNDDDLLQEVQRDRLRLYGANAAKVHHSLITRWTHALPVYDSVLERILQESELPERYFIVANYWGRIGLTKILDLSAEVAERIGDLK